MPFGGCTKFVKKTFHCHDAAQEAFKNNILDVLNIEKTTRFQQLIKSLFGLPPPTTDADGEGKWSLVLSDLAAVRICLGDTICDAIQCSPKHNPKPVVSQFSETSECVEARVPFDADQDAIIYIDVGSALKLADMLFPAASERVASILQSDPSSVSRIDFAHFTLQGASVPAIRLLFGTSIYEGIDQSELRNWEKDRLLLDKTDCITIQLRREQPEYGIIRLRVGFWPGVNLVNETTSPPQIWHPYPTTRDQRRAQLQIDSVGYENPSSHINKPLV
ncbi:uncharacterized protein N7518_000060 [Penicillium psychrosexuale]|uniref:uncharacterized protein n=1 Tax=Penicillium psychrosexuale TaxID=1002107 RepID=UPI0025459659|nr:uncharacterized protein N7518_000060 [Penicillium psychrosexuale]KAJ5803757.1 hypothetical protein N7518_000060 [Penicillium psychrosexuale]